MKTMKTLAICAIALLSTSMSLSAQETATTASAPSVSVTAGADVVSSYIWRGVYFAGASFQPTVNLSYGGLNAGIWGSSDFVDGNYKEVDASLFYTFSGLKFGLTQYWWSGKNKPYIGTDSINSTSGHYLEATIGYSISNFNLVANTFVLGARDQNAKGKQMYSTYIEASYSFNVGDVTLMPAVGVSPWESNSNIGYHWNPSKIDPTTGAIGMNETGVKICNVSLKATKSLKFSETLSIPVYVQTIYSNAADQIHFVLGVTL
jgi:hypothetical protein